MLERFRDKTGWGYYDIQIKFTLNPLNWSMDYESYQFPLKAISFGPITVFVYYGHRIKVER